MGGQNFSDNYFDMGPGEVREINVHRGPAVEKGAAAITVKSLRDSFSNEN